MTGATPALLLPTPGVPGRGKDMNSVAVPSFFGAVLGALDTLTDQLPAGTTDADVTTHLERNRKAYGWLWQNGVVAPDYSTPAARVGYVFAYVPAHAAFMKHGLDTCPSYIPTQSPSGSLSVTSIGGGPGSDLLGFFAHLIERGHRFDAISCVQADREPGWTEVVNAVVAEHIVYLPAWVNHKHVDFAHSATFQPQAGLFSTDIILGSYLLSELVRNRAATDAFFHAMGAQATPGTLFIVLDNNADALVPHYDAMMEIAGFSKQTSFCEDLRIDEGRDVLDGYATRYNSNTKINGRIYFGIYRKD